MTPKTKKSKITVATGKLPYNAGIQKRYEQKLRDLIERMTSETTRKIIRLFKSMLFKDYKESVAMDDSISSQAGILTNELYNKFTVLFAKKAKPLAKWMVIEEMKASKKTIKKSLKYKKSDIALKGNLLSPGIREAAKATITENIGLIKSIPEQYMKNIQGAVMRHITNGGGITGIKKILMKEGEIGERRAQVIADDQTRKTYNAINALRGKQTGAKKFKWLHSGGGQHPRPDHVAMNNKVFSFDDLPIIDQKTGERGIPGQAIRCRCTMSLIYEFNGEEF